MASLRIHSHTIDAVKERADIVDIVSEHVVLKKRGQEFIGICPFHDDSRPSMTVSPAKQFYYCFSCGAGGNAIKFLMEFQHQSFADVVLQLARRYQLTVETIGGLQQKQLRQQFSHREQLYRALALSASWFRNQLCSSEGAMALTYLKEKRGLGETTLKVFGIGYAPDCWDALLSYLGRVEQIPPSLLEKAGLAAPRKGGKGFYDRFRHRVMIPISDRQGRVVGFGGRSLNQAGPKYLNSPETEVFEKSKHLFGLNLAASAIRHEDQAVIVEGYFDVMALHAVGITNAVASLGTALSASQITQICRCSDSKRVILNFDTDRAGIKAANRAISEVEQLALQGQLELRVLQLPLGKDPDEFLKTSSSGNYRVLLNQAPLWLDWQITQVLRDRDLSQADQFQQAISALVLLLGKLTQPTVRTHYLKQVAEHLSGGQGRLALQLEEDLRRQVKGKRLLSYSRRHENLVEISQRERCEAEILRLYLHCPVHRAAIRRELRQRGLDEFDLGHHRLFWEAITELERIRLGTNRLEAINCGDDSGIELADLDMPQLLSNQLLLEDDSLLARLALLLEPEEVHRASLDQPLHQLRGAVALLERQKSLKRCQYLLEAWSKQHLQTLEQCITVLLETPTLIDEASNINMEVCIQSLFEELNSNAIKFQRLYYSEREHIIHLDRQRCGGYTANNI